MEETLVLGKWPLTKQTGSSSGSDIHRNVLIWGTHRWEDREGMDHFGVLARGSLRSLQSNSKGFPGDVFSFLLLLPIISVVRL